MARNLNIMIVDDDRSVAEAISEVLKEEGFNTYIEQDGSWALRVYKKRRIDLMLIDVVLSGMDGLSLAKNIRDSEIKNDIPIILLSGIYKDKRHIEREMKSLNLQGFITKPINREELIELLRQIFQDAYPKKPKKEIEQKDIEQDSSVIRERLSFKRLEKAEGEGNLADMPFPYLLSEIYRLRWTGMLALRKNRVKKDVYFQDGYPIYVNSNLVSECLGNIMVQEKIITESEKEESVRRMKSTKRQQGTILIEMGVISPHNLQYALEKQLLKKLINIFAWRSATYRFVTEEVAPQIITIEKSPASIIFDGISEKYTPQRAYSLIKEYLNKYITISSDPVYRFQDLEVDSDHLAFLREIDGRKRMKDLLSNPNLDKASTVKFLLTLITAGIVELHDTPTTDTTSSIKPGRLRTAEMLIRRQGPPPISKTKIKRFESKRSLAETARKMSKMNYFEILGVKRNATEQQIKNAYFELARRYHPDRAFKHASNEVKLLASEIYNLITKAYRTLSDRKMRLKYISDLKRKAQKDLSNDVGKILAAEGAYMKGEQALRRKDYSSAYKHFARAISLYDEAGEYHAYYGWCTFKAHPGSKKHLEEAIKHIEKSISLNPKFDRAYLFLGWIYKNIGKMDDAELQFEKAIQANPDCVEAMTELKLLELDKQR